MMDIDKIALTWLVSIIGALGAAVVGLILLIMKSTAKKADEKIDANKKSSDERIGAVESSITKWVEESRDRSEECDRKIETVAEKIRADQQEWKKSCETVVAAINKSIADKEMMALKTFAEKTEVNALRVEHGRTLERIHDKLDKMSEKLGRSQT
jgi:nucleoid DNA-binding protein